MYIRNKHFRNCIDCVLRIPNSFLVSISSTFLHFLLDTCFGNKMQRVLMETRFYASCKLQVEALSASSINYARQQYLFQPVEACTVFGWWCWIVCWQSGCGVGIRSRFLFLWCLACRLNDLSGRIVDKVQCTKRKVSYLPWHEQSIHRMDDPSRSYPSCICQRHPEFYGSCKDYDLN